MRSKRGGWSGGGSFVFEVERYLHLPTGEYFQVGSAQVPSDVDERPEEWVYQEIPLTITGCGYYTPGYTTGLPEDCYPDEGSLEVESILGPDGTDWEDTVTPQERKTIEERLVAFCKDGEEP